MRHVIAILGILFCFFLWMLPTVMIWNGFGGNFGFLYLPITALTLGWGLVLAVLYEKEFEKE